MSPVYYTDFQSTDPLDARRLNERFQGLSDAVDAISVLFPTGVVIEYGAGAIPAGWLACDGSVVSRTTYAALFGVIGTTYGVGDGSTTFNLPDTRGRTIVGAGAGAGLTNRAVAATFGEENHQLTTAELPAHTHAAPTSTFGLAADTIATRETNPNTSMGNTGSNTPHNNMQPSLIVNRMIKT